MQKSTQKPIPFAFFLEALEKHKPTVRPMFGCHAIYIKDKIVAIVRRKDSAKKDNGIWIATGHEHHESLQNDFPSLAPVEVLGKNGGWRMIPENAADFEESAFRICELISKNDPRIGKVPKARKRKK